MSFFRAPRPTLLFFLIWVWDWQWRKRWRWVGRALCKPPTNITSQAEESKREKHLVTDLEAEAQKMGYTWMQLEKMVQDKSLEICLWWPHPRTGSISSSTILNHLTCFSGAACSPVSVFIWSRTQKLSG